MSSISDIPSDIFYQIVKSLEVVEFIRVGAVCTAWRNLLDRKYYCNKPQIPWLMLSSRDKPEYRYFYNITEKKKYNIYLPDIAGRLCVGSSQGFLISVDNNADLHATNPLTGTHLPLPPTSNSPHFDILDFRYIKVILSPSRDIVVANYGHLDYKLAFTRVGDDKWNALDTPFKYDYDDAIFHKGRLYAINYRGTIAIFDDLDIGKPSLVSPEPPLHLRRISKSYLVESPDGEDLFWVFKDVKGMRVFLFDKATYIRNEMKTLGDIALFLGFNYSMSLCTRDYPGLRRNCIYFTYDNYFFYKDDMGVFNLEDGTIEPIYVNDDLDPLHWQPPILFMPTLS